MHSCLYLKDFSSSLFFPISSQWFTPSLSQFRYWLHLQDRQRHDAELLHLYFEIVHALKNICSGITSGSCSFPLPKNFPLHVAVERLEQKYAEQHMLNIHCKSSLNSKQKTRCNKNMHHLTWNKTGLIPWELLSFQTYSLTFCFFHIYSNLRDSRIKSSV